MSQLKKYQKSKVLTASNQEIIILLYQEIIKLLRLSQKENNDLEKRNNYILKTMEIIQCLELSLEENKNPELVKNLKVVYSFCMQKLSESLKNKIFIEEVIILIDNLYQSWIKVLK